MTRWITTVALVCSLFAAMVPPAPLLAEDRIATALEKAKQEYETTAKAARNEVVRKIDETEERLQKNTRLSKADKAAALERVQAERKSFVDSRITPKSQNLTAVSRNYREELSSARDRLLKAYDKAISEYTLSKDTVSTESARRGKGEFLKSFAKTEEPQWVAIGSPVTSKVLGVSDSSTAPGAEIVQWEVVKLAADQCWVFVPVDDEWFLIQNRKSGLVLAISENAPNDGARVIQWPAVEQAFEHHWKAVAVGQRGSKAVLLKNRKTEKVLSLESASQDNGVRIAQWKELAGALHQQWVIIPVE